MQKFMRIAAAAVLVMAAAVKSIAVKIAHKAHDAVFGYMASNGMVMGMVLLGRSYAGYAAATIVQLSTNEEAALIAQGMATASAGPVTPGAVTTSKTAGRVGVAAAASSVVITNPAFDVNSKFLACLSNAAADGTATSISRITPAAGSVTFTLNAAATAAVAIDWALLMVSGELPPTNS
jgi:hypothetical protein